MSKPTDLTSYARAGYDGNECNHLPTSPIFYAYKLGEYLHDTGRAPPYGVRMSRGSKIHANGKLWRIDDERSIKHPKFSLYEQ